MLPRDESGVDSERMERALAFLRMGSALQGLPADRHRAIEQRLDEQPRRPERPRLLVPALAALGILLFTGTAVALVGGHLESLPLVGGLFAREEPNGSPSKSTRGRHKTMRADVDSTAAASDRATVPEELSPVGAREIALAPAAAPDKAVENLAPAPERPARVSSTPPVSRSAATGRSKPAAPPETQLLPSTIAEESRSFAVVLEIWHHQHDARRALAALDAHERRFPGGEMSLEIRITRAELFLTLGEQQKALAELDPLALVDVPHARELHVVRGELRIKASRCDDGKADLLGIAAGSDALARRAAQALSDCR